MHVILLMAGEGQRFKDAGYTIPKPFIPIKNKMIVEWTLSSIPNVIKNNQVHIAIQKKDFTKSRAKRLRELCGKDTKFHIFSGLTRGNLDTAYQVTRNIKCDQNESILILDSDNYYNGEEVEKFLANPEGNAAVFYFQNGGPIPKWCYIKQEKGWVTQVGEKDPELLKNGGVPLIGTFWFKNKFTFCSFAHNCLENPINGEYYLSAIIKDLCELEDSKVRAISIKWVKPLGTPEDLDTFVNPFKRFAYSGV